MREAAVVTLDVEEAEAVRRAQRGDHAAFRVLVSRHQAAVLRYGLALVGDEARAQDLAQDVFVTFWNERERYVHRGRLRAYLLKIAKHRGLAQLKKLKSQARLQSESARIPPSPVKEPLEDVERRQTRVRMEAALSKLPEDRREVLRLRFLVGLPVAEIADLLAIPVGTVKSRVGRGLAELRKELSS